MSTVVDSTSVTIQLQALQHEVERLLPFERKCRDIEQRYDALVEEHDVWTRMLRNSNVSPVYQKLYIALVELAPGLLLGLPVEVSLFKLRECAGWVSEESATKFFQDMQTIGAFTYHPGTYNKEKNERIGRVTPNPEIFPFPEYFDTRKVEKRQKARDAEKKKRDERNAAWRLYQCEVCGSPDVKYDLHPICNSCKHKHAPVEGIDANRITIEPAENADGDIDWTQEDIPDEPAPAAEPVNRPALKLVPTQKCPTCHEVNWSESGECITCWIYGGGGK